MNSILKWAFELTLVVLLLVGCSGATAKPTTTPTPIPPTATPTTIPPTTIPPTATPTTIPPTATPTTIPPTATPKNIIAQADATFVGSMTVFRAVDGVSAERGEIEFMTSVEGDAIVSLSVSLFDMTCAYEYDYTFAGVRSTGNGTETAASGTLSSNLTFPIFEFDRSFEFENHGLQIDGHFTSSTEANGVISISQEIHPPDLPPGTNITCDYGSWEWNANVQ